MPVHKTIEIENKFEILSNCLKAKSKKFDKFSYFIAIHKNMETVTEFRPFVTKLFNSIYYWNCDSK